MRDYSRAAKAMGHSVGLVPTMGALHAGHLSLLDYVKTRCQCLVVSIFVNPLQFDRADDLAKYPRTWEADLDLCAAHGADAIYSPTPAAMYPEGFASKVSVAGLTQGLCGAHRPGHFDGVTTVVMKLFNAVEPDLAAFGEKDYQQLAVIARMARDLDLGVEVVGRPTLREPDGLAMSSRNTRLSPQDRAQALCLYHGLTKARALALAGEKDVAVLVAAARTAMETTPQADVEYLEVVDAVDLAPLTTLDRPARMACAVWLGGVRLIDHLALH
jgi:pantoate--beta-alanine ligase